jgi:hypothetical protein
VLARQLGVPPSHALEELVAALPVR